jgi:hypothetical protein
LGEFALRADDQQVVALRQARLIVDFFARQQEHIAFFVIAIIAFDALDEHVMVGDDDKIDARDQRGSGNMGVIAFAVRVRSVGVQIADVFVKRC